MTVSRLSWAKLLGSGRGGGKGEGVLLISGFGECGGGGEFVGVSRMESCRSVGVGLCGSGSEAAGVGLIGGGGEVDSAKNGSSWKGSSEAELSQCWTGTGTAEKLS